MATVRFDGAGVKLAADVAGPATGAPVILLHGGGQTRASWGSAVRQGAKRGYRMFAVDLRGHGESDWSPDGAYGIDRYMADLHAIVATLPTPPFIVGASLGGVTSLLYAGEGGAIRGLVLVDIAHRIEEKGTTRIQAFMTAKPEGFESIDEAAEAVSTYLPHRQRPADTSGLGKNLRQGADGRFRWHWDPNILSHGVIDQDRLTAAAQNLKAPSLLVRGGLSEVVSLEGAREFLSLAPQSEFINIADADHMIAGDRNDAFNTATFAFLDKHSGRIGPAKANGPSTL